MPSSKNVRAAFITYCVALIILWFIWGHTTNHIWSALLFLVLFLAGIIVFILMIIRSLQTDSFDLDLIFAVVGVVFFDLFLLGSVGDIGLSLLSILARIFSGLLLLLLIFTGIRYAIR